MVDQGDSTPSPGFNGAGKIMSPCRTSGTSIGHKGETSTDGELMVGSLVKKSVLSAVHTLQTYNFVPLHLASDTASTGINKQSNAPQLFGQMEKETVREVSVQAGTGEDSEWEPDCSLGGEQQSASAVWVSVQQMQTSSTDELMLLSDHGNQTSASYQAILSVKEGHMTSSLRYNLQQVTSHVDCAMVTSGGMTTWDGLFREATIEEPTKQSHGIDMKPALMEHGAPTVFGEEDQKTEMVQKKTVEENQLKLL